MVVAGSGCCGWVGVGLGFGVWFGWGGGDGGWVWLGCGWVVAWEGGSEVEEDGRVAASFFIFLDFFLGFFAEDDEEMMKMVENDE